MNHPSTRTLRTTLVAGAIATLLGCASAPATNPQLERARAAYDQAARNALIVRAAPVELQRAQQALQRAESALKAGENMADVEHYAYLASQRTEVAVQAGRIAQADADVAKSQAQRDRILIDARGKEAEAQRLAAERAKMSADQSRSAAEKAKADADKARMEAEKAQADATTARTLADQRLAAAEAARQQAEAAKARAGSLEAEMAAMKAKQTDRGMVLTLGDVLFDSGKATLKAGAMRTVDQLATFLAKNPARKVLIEGHTDSQGGDEFNRALSQRRAEAVRNALTGRGVPADRVAVDGLGEAFPVANNDTAAGRQQNRRVEVVFSDDAGQVKARTR